MKTFRLIGMALFAVLMCVNFASCTKEENDSLSSKIVGEWGSYQLNNWKNGYYYWEDCDTIRRITFYPNGTYSRRTYDYEGNSTGYSRGTYEFSEDETELYIDGDTHKVLISTKALDEKPFEPDLIIISGDFNRMKLWGWKIKRL